MERRSSRRELTDENASDLGRRQLNLQNFMITYRSRMTALQREILRLEAVGGQSVQAVTHLDAARRRRAGLIRIKESLETELRRAGPGS